MDFSHIDADQANLRIQIGTWIDWSRGHIFGATITTTNRTGIFLITLLALFVSFVGTSFWNISCFALHYLYSTESPRDALYHQRQAILRNSANATYGSRSVLQVLWAWRKDKRVLRPCRRMLPLLLFSVLVIGAFATAGTFSSKVATAFGHEVLVSGSSCGAMKPTSSGDMATHEVLKIFMPYVGSRISSSADYARQCYATQSASDNCYKYIKSSLPTTIIRNATCPFEKNICRLQNGNIVLDTGYLDSHLDLGLNAPPEDRILFRRRTSCAPLVTEGYKKTITYGGDTNYTQYLYGPSKGEWTSGNSVTYEYPSFSEKELFRNGSTSAYNSAYTIMMEGYRISNGTMDRDFSTWEAIPELTSQDSDTVIIFLSANWVLYASQVDDPWYSAHRVGGRVAGLLLADEDASPLACKVQQQFCNPNLPRETGCSPFSGTYEALTFINPDAKTPTWTQRLWSSERQKRIFTWIGSVAGTIPDLSDALMFLGSSGLTSRFSLSTGFQGSLRDDQWQLDVEFLHNTSMAFLQSYVVEVAKGPSDPRIEESMTRPSNQEERSLCKSQKVRSPVHINFSVFYLSITLSVGAFIIVLSYILEPLVSRIQCRYKLDTFPRLEWASNGTLELQRLAHEEVGAGEWMRCVNDVPITADGRERLAILDIEDLKHPRLKRPLQGWDELLTGGAGPAVEAEDGEREGDDDETGRELKVSNSVHAEIRSVSEGR